MNKLRKVCPILIRLIPKELMVRVMKPTNYLFLDCHLYTRLSNNIFSYFEISNQSCYTLLGHNSGHKF